MLPGRAELAMSPVERRQSASGNDPKDKRQPLGGAGTHCTPPGPGAQAASLWHLKVVTCKIIIYTVSGAGFRAQKHRSLYDSSRDQCEASGPNKNDLGVRGDPWPPPIGSQTLADPPEM